MAAVLLLGTTLLAPLNASAQSESHLAQQAVRSAATPSLSTMVFLPVEVCASVNAARAADFAAAESTAVSKAIADFPAPEATVAALGVLADGSADAAVRELAQRAVLRFFGGVCTGDADSQRTACTLFVTLRVAQNIQVELLASQMRFALHNTGISADLDSAIAVLALGEDEGESDEFTAAVATVITEMTDLCARVTSTGTGDSSTAVATASAPEALPATGLSDGGIDLLRVALAAVALGAALLATCAQRFNRTAQR